MVAARLKHDVSSSTDAMISKLFVETRSIGHVTQAPHGPIDHAGTIRQGTKTEQADPVPHGHGGRLSLRHAQTDLHSINRLTRKCIGQSNIHGWSVVVDDG